MALITIDNIEMPDPQKYSFPMQDMVSGDSSYNENGVAVRNRIRQGMFSIDLSWTATGENAEIILSAIEPDRVQVHYFDPRVNDYRNADMFVGDRSCELVKLTSTAGAVAKQNLWTISFTLTQY